ncbi:MAG TPA: bacillithiol biosynthesis deacetylase BshB1 [Acidobacteriota bacterium]|nr:bacillithiol biosynthesis deacetylase BshB1 [Acidobacteriota bacterium]
MRLDIIAFGAHPDDVELFAGGTLAKMAALGHATGIVDMSGGEKGTRGSRAQRAREAKEAARILGVRIRENLGLPDGQVESTPRARLKVIRVLRNYRPLVVLTHHWDDRHPDHVNTSRLVMEAAHHAGLAKIKTGQERFRPGAILYFKLPTGCFPSLIVDVSEFCEPRTRAIQAYRSQLFDPGSREPATYLSQPDFLTHVENVHAFYGTLIGKRLGEGFYAKGIPEIPDLVEFFKGQSSSRFR